MKRLFFSLASLQLKKEEPATPEAKAIVDIEKSGGAVRTLAQNDDRPGYLCVKGKPIQPVAIARIVGADKAEVESLMAELTDHHVPSVEESTGCWYSRRLANGRATGCLM